MGWRSQGRSPSVDRGRTSWAIEPRKHLRSAGGIVCRAGNIGRAVTPDHPNSAGSENPCVHANTSPGSREIPGSATVGKDHSGPRRQTPSRETAMNEPGKSDRPIVPGNPANEGHCTTARPKERGEGRGLAKENLIQCNSPRTQSRARLQRSLDRIRQAARRD